MQIYSDVYVCVYKFVDVHRSICAIVALQTRRTPSEYNSLLTTLPPWVIFRVSTLLPRDAMRKRGTSRRAVSVRLSVRRTRILYQSG